MAEREEIIQGYGVGGGSESTKKSEDGKPRYRGFKLARKESDGKRITYVRGGATFGTIICICVRERMANVANLMEGKIGGGKKNSCDEYGNKAIRGAITSVRGEKKGVRAIRKTVDRSLLTRNGRKGEDNARTVPSVNILRASSGIRI